MKGDQRRMNVVEQKAVSFVSSNVLKIYARFVYVDSADKGQSWTKYNNNNNEDEGVTTVTIMLKQQQQQQQQQQQPQY